MSGALDFLSPGLARDHGDQRPVARSAIERAQRDAGATFEERDGWLVPVSLPDEEQWLQAVGVADLSHLSKLEVRPAPDTLDGGILYRISPRRALVLCEPRELDAIRSRLGDGLVVDVTAGLGIVALAGPEAGTVLRRLTHLHHFPSGGEVAHVTAHVLEQGSAYWIVVAQEYAHYLWEVAVDRAAALGGGPVGVDALGRAAS